MTPLTTTVQMLVNSAYGRWTTLVETMPEHALNWQPPAPETNAVAQLVRHVVTVQDFLLLRALGEAETYDMAHSLRNDPATRDELLTLLHEANARKDDLLTRIDGLDLSGTLTNRQGRAVPKAWYVVHTADHGAEHLGHAELTAQLWRAQHAE